MPAYLDELDGLRERQSRTNSGSLQLSQMAFEWSQKSLTIWTRPCWAAAPGKARGEVVPSRRCRARRSTELSSAGGQAKYRCSSIRCMEAFLPSTARIQSQGSMTFTARSVTRVAPRRGWAFLSRGERNVQCQDQ